jgi:acyl-CoA reductase-like NAD-dependent aldehyde dehydrogenase
MSGTENPATGARMDHERGTSAPVPSRDDIVAAAARLRATMALKPAARNPAEACAVFAEVKQRIISAARERNSAWHDSIRRIADRYSYSKWLLEESLLALLEPLSDIRDFADKLPQRRKVIGLIMPGNVPGAGLHELVAALVAGCAAIVKSATSEPIFFAEFAKTLEEVDATSGTCFHERVAVFDWGRNDVEPTNALRESCDWLVAFGTDSTITRLSEDHGQRIVGFGTRVSGVIITRDSIADAGAMNALADTVVRDVGLFDQRGCLSPHHIFVEDDRQARAFADLLAARSDKFDIGRVPRRLGLEDAAAVRRVREVARWREIGGGEVALHEAPDFAWTVIYDRDADFRVSPMFRTVFVSTFTDLRDLQTRLAPISGHVEGFALAARAEQRELLRRLVERLGTTYVCEPGRMQSPPIDWPHGGGAFLRTLLDTR